EGDTGDEASGRERARRDEGDRGGRADAAIPRRLALLRAHQLSSMRVALLLAPQGFERDRDGNGHTREGIDLPRLVRIAGLGNGYLMLARLDVPAAVERRAPDRRTIDVDDGTGHVDGDVQFADLRLRLGEPASGFRAHVRR